jgi:hypothetical protein
MASMGFELEGFVLTLTQVPVAGSRFSTTDSLLALPATPRERAAVTVRARRREVMR